MKHLFLLLFIFNASGIFSGSAQTVSSQKGLTTAIFNLAAGTIKIYLPDDMMPGDAISGSIIADPTGKDPKQTGKNLAILKKYVVDFNGQQFPVSNTGYPMHFILNKNMQLQQPLSLVNLNGAKFGQVNIQCLRATTGVNANVPCKIPAHALTEAPFRITGPFDGNSSNTRCFLDGKALEVLVESKRQCIIQYPGNSNGVHSLEIQENDGQKCERSVSGVNMQVSAGKLDLLKGEQTFIEVLITGLQNLPDTALLTLTNTTPEVVVMQPSNAVLIFLPPDSAGKENYSRRFAVTSIKSGTFTVNVNLDLPDEYGSSDHPLITTGQTHCGCHADCSIVKAESRNREVSYAISLSTECRGNCYVDKATYKWHIGESGKDVAEIDGLDFTKFVTVKLKKPGDYTVYLSGTITCSDGTKCEFNCNLEEKVPDETTGHPPTTAQPQCKCHADCSIVKAETKDGEAVFLISMVTECKGNCYVEKTTYKWHIGESGKDVAEIDGIDFGKSVTVKLKKAGNYTLYLSGTVTCSDGSSCEFHCSLEETVPKQPTTGEPICTLVPDELVGPKMDGNLKERFTGIRKIKRDEFIALGAEGADYDLLKWTCIPSPDCDKENSVKTILLNGRVKFKWECRKGEGSFLKMGCLPKDQISDSGDHVIFKPPYLEIPRGKKKVTITFTIKLSIIDDNHTQPLDDTMYHLITIIMNRSDDEPDEYTIEVKRDKSEMPIPNVPDPVQNNCRTEGPTWTEDNNLETSVIELPKVKESDRMVTGEWMILNAGDQLDKDHLKINCVSGKCKNPPPWEKDYEDNVLWEWQPLAEGVGRYIGADPDGKVYGQYIIYEAPLEFGGKNDMLEVTIRVKIRNPDGLKINDNEKEGTVTLKIFRGGVKLDYPPVTWLPTGDGKVKLTSSLMYKDVTWKPALAHMGRIHFFELLNVSEEKGVCMNDPVPNLANACRDLLLQNEEGVEAFNDKTDPVKCTLKEQYLQGRTKEPEREYAITLYSRDYGAYGFMRSFANAYKDDKPQGPLYVSIPWTNETVQHLHNPLRTKKRVYNEKTRQFEDYPDDRVTIPYDIDENHIADNGYPRSDNVNIQVPDPILNNADEDANPAGDSFNGDGLSTYEEYRGFIVQAGTKKTAITTSHVRTDNNTKTIFIRNENDLPFTLYKKITGLEVFEFKETRYYQHDDIRVVNFNSPPVISAAGAAPSTHLLDQRGLLLKDGGTNGLLHGKAFSTDDRPSPPNWAKEVMIYVKTIKNYYDPLLELAAKAAAREAAKKNALAVLEKDPVKKKKLLDEAKELEKEAGMDKKAFIEEKIAATVAHELLHANNVCHHGEGDQSATGTYNKVGGLRSGNYDCVMRYDNMGENITGGRMEAIGSILCDAAAGTGYNANGRHYGNALEGRGNCMHQFRVSGMEPRPDPCGNRPLR